MQRVLIVGAGGHAQVVADILLRMRDAGQTVEPLGYVDDNPAMHGRTLLRLPVLGPMNYRTRIAHDAVVVAIGNNRTRRTLYGQLQREGEQFASVWHPSAIVAPDVQIGSGTMIVAGVVINPGAVIGANVILNTHCSIDHHCRIADHVHIAPGATLGGDVQIGEGSFIGIGATVMPQRKVGAWSVVGAGALAHSHVADRVVVVGVPGRVMRPVEEVE